MVTERPARVNEQTASSMQQRNAVPLILQNLVLYKGAMYGTTTGTYDNPDGADNT